MVGQNVKLFLFYKNLCEFSNSTLGWSEHREDGKWKREKIREILGKKKWWNMIVFSWPTIFLTPHIGEKMGRRMTYIEITHLHLPLPPQFSIFETKRLVWESKMDRK